MNTSSSYFINVPCNELVSATVRENLESDPLKDVGTALEEPMFYRLEEAVFAEPIHINLKKRRRERRNSTHDKTIDEDKSIFIDNDIVQTRQSKKKNGYDTRDEHNVQCSEESCEKSFKSKCLMRAHVRKVHTADKSRYICEFCCMGFPALYLMRRHIQTHNAERVKCPICLQTFSPRTDMKVHLRTHSGVRNYQCRICSKKFTRSSVLTIHLKSVHRTPK